MRNPWEERLHRIRTKIDQSLAENDGLKTDIVRTSLKNVDPSELKLMTDIVNMLMVAIDRQNTQLRSIKELVS